MKESVGHSKQFDFISTKMGNHRMFQVWESCEPICSFKGQSGNCGEWILEVRVETERIRRRKLESI